MNHQLIQRWAARCAAVLLILMSPVVLPCGIWATFGNDWSAIKRNWKDEARVFYAVMWQMVRTGTVS